MINSFFEVLKNEKPLSVAGTINPYSALLAKKTGIKALYISGAGVANASFGLPDLALTSLDNVVNNLWKDLSSFDCKATIIFAPACASFDQFENFEKRGNYFNKLILNKIKK